jgi:hypothetical protein
MKGMGFVNELNISKNVFISFNCNVKGGRAFDVDKDDIEGDDDDDFDVGVVGILVVSLLLLERLSLFISSSKKSEIDSKNKSSLSMGSFMLVIGLSSVLFTFVSLGSIMWRFFYILNGLGISHLYMCAYVML